jgi:hypothetical protein
VAPGQIYSSEEWTTAQNAALRWSDLLIVEVGDPVVFVAPWKIVPGLQIDPGETGAVRANFLNEIHRFLIVRPDNPELREALADWDGEIMLMPDLDGENDDEVWNSASPIALAP